MKQTILLATAMLGLSAIPALSQEAQCFQNDQFLVIAQERTDEVGTDFLVRPPARGKIACVFEQQPDDMLIGSPDDPLWFEGLAGQYLVLTRSTGPEGDLVIYDLKTELFMPLLDVRADDELTISETEVTYWPQLIGGTAVNCPSFAENTANGLGSMIYEERVLNLAALTVAATGKTLCSSTQ
ncbi:MAG: hypothetical protein JWQ22_2037 [Devosia sp.]|nr:hypothetical protein [Devosia sp.]